MSRVTPEIFNICGNIWISFCAQSRIWLHNVTICRRVCARLNGLSAYTFLFNKRGMQPHENAYPSGIPIPPTTAFEREDTPWNRIFPFAWTGRLTLAVNSAMSVIVSERPRLESFRSIRASEKVQEHAGTFSDMSVKAGAATLARMEQEFSYSLPSASYLILNLRQPFKAILRWLC